MIITFSIALTRPVDSRTRHMLRRPANWLSHLNKHLLTDFHSFSLLSCQKVTSRFEDEKLRNILLDNEGRSKLLPFAMACKMDGQTAHMYIESESPFVVYALYCYKWGEQNGTISVADTCHGIPNADWTMLRWCNHLPMQGA